MFKVMIEPEVYRERTLAPTLRQAATQFPAVVLTGPRQSGKTTLARHTSAGHEVDFVIEDGLRLWPLEVKLTATPKPAHARSLERFMDLFPERAPRGWLVCLTGERMPLTERVEAIPFDALG